MVAKKAYFRYRLFAAVIGFSSAAYLWMPSLILADEAADFARLMNVGKAHLENRESTKAIEAFEAASRSRPRSTPAWRNLARAYLLARLPEKALSAVETARSIEPELVSTAYLTGLTLLRLARTNDAVSHFETAVRLDARTAALRFQLANAYAVSGKRENAEEQYRETVRLDPLHAAAHFKLANHAKESGNQMEYQEHMREFTRLRKLFGDEARSPEALEVCVYTRPEGPDQAPEEPEVASAIDVRFTDSTADVFGKQSDREAIAICVVDMDAAGRYTLFLVDAKGDAYLLRLAANGRFERERAGVNLGEKVDFMSCVAGDFHNDVPKDAKYDPEVHALTDVFLIGPSSARLLKRKTLDTFDDVTQAAGLGNVRGHRAAWMDYEHDGDVDLVVAGEGGVELWQNNGDGRFIEVTPTAGLGGIGSATDVAASDLENNVAVDLVVARGKSPTLVFANQRAGRFARTAEPPGPWPAARRVLLDDLDNDGQPDAALVGEESVELVCSRDLRRQRIEFHGTLCSSAALPDFDNDGWLDLLILGRRADDPTAGVARLWRGALDGRWKEVTDSVRMPPLSSAILDGLAADLDGDADSDLLLLGSDGALRYFRNDGGHRNGQLKLRLQGTKTNPMGIGTHVELRAGSFWITRSVRTLPVELGLTGRMRIDSLQTVWTNGVVENRIGVEGAPKPLTIVEKNVAAGSCPFLYAWDGQGFRFVTDLLGNSPLGLPLRRDSLLPADPDEIVLIGDERSFAPREDAYRIEITSEFREVLYLDHVRLLAVDHRAGVEVHPTDKLMPPPFPPSEVWELEPAAALRSARGSDGLDRTEALRAIDGIYATPGLPLPSPYRGMCYPLTLTLEFEELDVSTPVVLALTGWLQYGDGSTNIALSQSDSVQIIPPTLEVESTAGGWKPIDAVVGMPAGKTKTILCELHGLPNGARRLRLTTTFEIRWDRIAILRQPAKPHIVTHELPPSKAALRWRGFSELKSRAAGHPTTPYYGVVSERPPWRTTPQGWCTRYGDVLDLVSQRDGELALVNSGDALTVDFAADHLPALQDRMVRTFLLYSVGWDKDADHNVVDGDTVEPLPTTELGRPLPDAFTTPEAENENDWRVRYNTRWVPWNRFSPK